jgi:hypothetical protein
LFSKYAPLAGRPSVAAGTEMTGQGGLPSLCNSQLVTFDLGTVRVTSPPGGLTQTEAVIPCAR